MQSENKAGVADKHVDSTPEHPSPAHRSLLAAVIPWQVSIFKSIAPKF